MAEEETDEVEEATEEEIAGEEEVWDDEGVEITVPSLSTRFSPATLVTTVRVALRAARCAAMCPARPPSRGRRATGFFFLGFIGASRPGPVLL